MSLPWPLSPTRDQARVHAAAWCLRPAAERVLRRDRRVAAVVLALAPGTRGPVLALIEWREPGTLPRFLPPDCSPSERAHATLADIYGEDPLADLGEAAGAFERHPDAGDRWDVVAVVHRGEDGLERVVVPAELSGDERELDARSEALLALARIGRDVALLRRARVQAAGHGGEWSRAQFGRTVQRLDAVADERRAVPGDPDDVLRRLGISDEMPAHFEPVTPVPPRAPTWWERLRRRL